MAKDVLRQVMNAASVAAARKNIEVIDTAWVTEHKQRYLRVYLYRPEGINISDCEYVHREIDEFIDQLDISAPFIFEVSSIGYDKNLRTDREFEIFKDSKIALSLYSQQDGKKHYEGILMQRLEDTTQLLVEDKIIQFDNKNISKIKRVFDF